MNKKYTFPKQTLKFAKKNWQENAEKVIRTDQYYYLCNKLTNHFKVYGYKTLLCSFMRGFIKKIQGGGGGGPIVGYLNLPGGRGAEA